jgi:hypothetical protein
MMAIAALVAPSFVYAQGGDGNQRTVPYLTWDDAPVVDAVRHQGDARRRWDILPDYSPEPSPTYEVGMRTNFILEQGAEGVYTFELLYISEFAYFWFLPESDINLDDLRVAAARLDQEVWPLIKAIYGGNFSAGIDNDMRVHLVHAEGVMPTLAGFFAPNDQCARDICPDSNERDALYLMIDYGPVNSTRYMATVAHELQHLIRFQTEGNEYRWLDEGISQLVEHLTGFNEPLVTDENVMAFLNNPNHPLNTWSIDLGGHLPFYGSGYLFTIYLFERFGLDFIQALVNNPLDGLAAVNNTLKTTGQTVTLNELVAEWHIANLLNNPYAGDGRYYYSTYTLPGPVNRTPLSVSNGPVNYQSRMQQYGAQFFAIEQSGRYEITFDGQPVTDLVPVAPVSGNAMWWSNNAVSSAATLTRTVDLSAVDEATLSYDIWWETGQFPGYLHVLASTNGLHWEPLAGKSTFRRDAFGEAPGEHYSGRSNRWLRDSIDLTPYTGQEVQIRFEYVTNNAVAGPGFVLDNFEIPQIDWFDDVESGTRDWIADGFLRTGHQVMQDWALRVITNQSPPTILDVPVENGHAAFEIKVPDGGSTIMVGAMAPFTLTPANYELGLRLIN